MPSSSKASGWESSGTADRYKTERSDKTRIKPDRARHISSRRFIFLDLQGERKAPKDLRKLFPAAPHCLARRRLRASHVAQRAYGICRARRVASRRRLAYGALTEIHVERTGIGELQLVMPAAAHLTRSGRWLALIAPPYVPYAPAFMGHGVKLSRLMLVRTTSAEDSLWACEQALRSQTCGAALAWLDRIHERALRRLQLAAESGDASLLLFRSARAAPASTAALRLHVSKSQSRTLVRILKRRGGGLPGPVALDLYERWGTGPFGKPSRPSRSPRIAHVLPHERQVPRKRAPSAPFVSPAPSHDELSSPGDERREQASIAQ